MFHSFGRLPRLTVTLACGLRTSAANTYLNAPMGYTPGGITDCFPACFRIGTRYEQALKEKFPCKSCISAWSDCKSQCLFREPILQQEDKEKPAEATGEGGGTQVQNAAHGSFPDQSISL